jgi:hypothetical protein
MRLMALVRYSPFDSFSRLDAAQVGGAIRALSFLDRLKAGDFRGTRNIMLQSRYRQTRTGGSVETTTP